MKLKMMEIKSKERKKITRGNVLQDMHQKCNQVIFQTKRPTYHKGENFYLLCVMSIKKYLLPSCNVWVPLQA